MQFIVLPECILFYGWLRLALRKMVDLDMMVTRKFFFGINEGIQLAKHNSVINACLERPKLQITTYTSPHVQNENNLFR